MAPAGSDETNSVPRGLLAAVFEQVPDHVGNPAHQLVTRRGHAAIGCGGGNRADFHIQHRCGIAIRDDRTLRAARLEFRHAKRRRSSWNSAQRIGCVRLHGQFFLAAWLVQAAFQLAILRHHTGLGIRGHQHRPLTPDCLAHGLAQVGQKARFERLRFNQQQNTRVSVVTASGGFRVKRTSAARRGKSVTVASTLRPSLVSTT